MERAARRPRTRRQPARRGLPRVRPPPRRHRCRRHGDRGAAHRAAPGDRVEVRSGEIVPVDGVVLSGRSSLDNAVLTGEAVPVAVESGDSVHAGATNLGARLVVRVDATGPRTRVGALLAVVQEALAQKPALLQITDRMARRFVLVLLATAALTAAVVGALHGPGAAFTRVVALLVVSCPCALGLAVPLALSVALLRAARAGIFIKQVDAFERLRHVGTVPPDKTGTLTEGRATLARWVGDDRTRHPATALEAESAHHVARAFQIGASRTLHAVPTVRDVVDVNGHGIAGVVDGHAVRVGTRRHALGDVEPPADLATAAEACVLDGLSPVWVSVDGEAAGVAGIGDRLRADAAATVAALVHRGIRVRILSGDHPSIVARVGAALGLPAPDVIGGLTPEAKRDAVAALVGVRLKRAARS
ncbi:MAG: HAD-IC family P-type ATPase [Vicinamibacterales bacterium]